MPCLGDPLHGLEQLAAGTWRRWIASAGIDPPAILQFELVVEAEEVRRADGVVSAGNVLAVVIEIGKVEAALTCEAFHVVEGIVRIVDGIVGGDGDRIHAKTFQPADIPPDAIRHRLHIGTVIADEHHQRAVLPTERFELIGLPVGAWQREGGRLPAKIADGGMFSHCSHLFANLSWSRSSLTTHSAESRVPYGSDRRI